MEHGWGRPSRKQFLELKTQGHSGVFVQPIGFLCDHVEVLYDIDIGFQEFAKKHDLACAPIAERIPKADSGPCRNREQPPAKVIKVSGAVIEFSSAPSADVLCDSAFKIFRE